MSSNRPSSVVRSIAPAHVLIGCSILVLTLCVAGGPALAQQGPPAMVLTKTGMLDDRGDGVADAGDVIDYTIEILNQDMYCDVYDITVSDPRLTVTCASGNPVMVLTAGSTETCTGSYTLTQSDIDQGSVLNTASATGDVCREESQTVEDDHLEMLEQVVALEITKDGTLQLAAGADAGPGDTIAYSLEVTNAGNVTLTDVTITDALVGTVSCPGGHPIATLVPGDSATCTGSYIIDQADIDRGYVENTAEVVGQEPVSGTSATAKRQAVAQAMVRVIIPQSPAIQLQKSGLGDFGANGVADLGELITYTLVVENTGNVTLSSITVSDPLAAVTCPSANPIPLLAPGVSESCSATYALTASDLSTGSVANTATAEGQDPMLQRHSASDDEMVTLPVAMPTTGTVALWILSAALALGGAVALRRREVTS